MAAALLVLLTLSPTRVCVHVPLPTCLYTPPQTRLPRRSRRTKTRRRRRMQARRTLWQVGGLTFACSVPCFPGTHPPKPVARLRLPSPPLLACLQRLPCTAAVSCSWDVAPASKVERERCSASTLPLHPALRLQLECPAKNAPPTPLCHVMMQLGCHCANCEAALMHTCAVMMLLECHGASCSTACLSWCK